MRCGGRSSEPKGWFRAHLCRLICGRGPPTRNPPSSTPRRFPNCLSLFPSPHSLGHKSPDGGMSQMARCARARRSGDGLDVTGKPLSTREQIERAAEMDLSPLHSASLCLMILYFISPAKKTPLPKAARRNGTFRSRFQGSSPPW